MSKERKQAPNWSPAEKMALAEAWARGGMKAAVEACPERTPDACRRMAVALGVRVGDPAREEIARANRFGMGLVARYSRAHRITDAEIIEMRRNGASISDIADAGQVSLERVHRALSGQPRRLRFGGNGLMDRGAEYASTPNYNPWRERG